MVTTIDLVAGEEQGQRLAHAGHQFNGVMKNPVLLFLNPRFEIDATECAGDLVQRSAEGFAAVAGNLHIPLFSLPEQLMDAGWAMTAFGQRGHKFFHDALEVHVVLPQRVVSVHQQCADS